MISDWWQAHRFEFVLSGALLALTALVWLAESIVDIRRERAQRRKDGLL